MCRINCLLFSIVTLLFCLGESFAQEIPTKPDFVIVAKGIRTKLGGAYALNADCSAVGTTVVRELQKPQHGTLEIITEAGFTSYGKDDQRYKCNERQSEMVNWYYSSSVDFKGKDRFVVEVFYATGQYRKRVFNVDVR